MVGIGVISGVPAEEDNALWVGRIRRYCSIEEPLGQCMTQFMYYNDKEYQGQLWSRLSKLSLSQGNFKW